MKKSLNIAHRGFSGKYPENTMRAFEEAVKAGCDGVETDLHLTKDGIIVLCHDETLDRTTNGKGYIHEKSYKELEGLDAGSKFMGKPGMESPRRRYAIPTLDELLDFAKGRSLLINLELKNSIIRYPGLEEMVVRKIHEYRMVDSIIVSSFNHYSLVEVKELDSGIKTGILYASTLFNVHEYAKGLHADAVHPFFPSVQDVEIVNKIHDSGLMINAYTVNDEVHMREMIKLGIDGIITNYPDKLGEILNEGDGYPSL